MEHSATCRSCWAAQSHVRVTGGLGLRHSQAQPWAGKARFCPAWPSNQQEHQGTPHGAHRPRQGGGSCPSRAESALSQPGLHHRGRVQGAEETNAVELAGPRVHPVAAARPVGQNPVPSETPLPAHLEQRGSQDTIQPQTLREGVTPSRSPAGSLPGQLWHLQDPLR